MSKKKIVEKTLTRKLWLVAVTALYSIMVKTATIEFFVETVIKGQE